MPGAVVGRAGRHRRPVGEAAPAQVYLRAGALDELEPLDRGPYAGLVFGAEFCARRLPPLGAVARAADLCRGLGIPLSLVTPALREGALDRVAEWLEQSAPLLDGGECVFNDWGLLRWARRGGVACRPVAGRLLGRQRRGPRVLQSLRSASPAEGEALRGSLWDDPVAWEEARQLGVQRVELDYLLQGVRRPALPAGAAVSLCGPWLPVAVAPPCAWTRDPLHCGRECLGHPAVSRHSGEVNCPLWSRGNASFVKVNGMPAQRALLAVGADRLVWAEEIPG